MLPVLAAAAGRVAAAGAARMGAGKMGQRVAGSTATSMTKKMGSSSEGRTQSFQSGMGITVEPPTAPTSYIG